jgi:hypothetical protein
MAEQNVLRQFEQHHVLAQHIWEAMTGHGMLAKHSHVRPAKWLRPCQHRDCNVHRIHTVGLSTVKYNMFMTCYAYSEIVTRFYRAIAS